MGVTREEWLIALVEQLRPYFGRHKAAIPKELRITCGWTGKGVRTKAIGECWAGSTAADGQPHIYISPVLADPVAVGAVVVHELVHTVVGTEAKHGKEFSRVALRLGLKGPMRATTAGPQLEELLREMTRQLPAYAHSRVQGSAHPPRQKTRMIKLACPECGYLVRTTEKWIAVGVPTCPTDSAAFEISD